ncbi:TPA: hypothetical protein DEX38_00610, partial [Candidatus Uhrbacteria bacterium]|nr:hypothetical protein [Candidatus Uhrbacteria bacterium]
KIRSLYTTALNRIIKNWPTLSVGQFLTTGDRTTGDRTILGDPISKDRISALKLLECVES